jgi:hypothetical protein
MKIARVVVALTFAIGVAFLIAACGDDEVKTETEVKTKTKTDIKTETEVETDVVTDPSPPPPPPEQAEENCAEGEVYSQGAGECVQERNTGGNPEIPKGNPCPPGELPMADRPVCVPKD